MAIGVRAEQQLAQLEATQPLLASAVRLQLTNQTWKRNLAQVDQAWQRDAWAYYNIIGAFNYAANWIGNACSRAEIYVADVNELGVVGGRTEDAEVAAIADTLFGGPNTKAQIIKSIAISLTVAGECYVIGKGGKPGSGRDEWTVVAPYMVQPYPGGIWIGQGTGYAEKIPNGSALAFRVWNPRDDEPWYCVSPGKAALTTLRELEQLAKFKAAQTDSRLANAGIVWIPEGLDFVYGDDNPPGAPSLQQAIVDAMNAALEGKGSAAQLSPIVASVPKELMQFMPTEPMKFASVMSDQVRALEEVALQQLAITMSLPPEIVLGTGQSNQWSAWEVGESAVKYHIEPILNLALDALDIAYLNAAVKRLGKDPSRFTFQADTSALTVRPNRYTDALNAYNAPIPAISAEALRFYGDFREVDAPTEEELRQRFLWEIFHRDPQLVMDPELADGLNLGIETSLPVASTTPPPPAPDRVAVEGKQPMPARPSEAVAKQPSIIASIDRGEQLRLVGEPTALLAAAHSEVRGALIMAGKRMVNPATKQAVKGVEAHLIHTKLRVPDDEAAQRLTLGAFGGIAEAVAGTGINATEFTAMLAAYTHSLLKEAVPHDRNTLAAYMAKYGLKPWQS